MDAVPLGSDIVGSVVEDSTQGTPIALNGSDSDSKFVTFVITELPRMGKLYRATGEPIQTPFSVFEVRDFAPSCGFLDPTRQYVFGCRLQRAYRQCTPRL